MAQQEVWHEVGPYGGPTGAKLACVCVCAHVHSLSVQTPQVGTDVLHTGSKLV